MRFNSSKRRFISPPLPFSFAFSHTSKNSFYQVRFHRLSIRAFLVQAKQWLLAIQKITYERKVKRLNSPKRGVILPLPRSPLPLCTPPNTTFTKFEFTAHQFALFLFKLSSSLWQRVNIIYERKALSHSGLSMHKYQPKALMSGKHNK